MTCPFERNAAQVIDAVNEGGSSWARRLTPNVMTASSVSIALLLILASAKPACSQEWQTTSEPIESEFLFESAEPITPLSTPKAPPTVLRPLRWWRRSGASRAPVSTGTPVVPDTMSAMAVQLELTADATCDPDLSQHFAEELRTALNSQPAFRVTTADTADKSSTTGPERMSSLSPVLSGPFLEQEPVISAADLILSVHLRAIQPYRPIRVDAALELRDASTGQVLVVFDGVWTAPVDSVVMRANRHGWLRRNWRPTPTMTEGAALEASSPRLFIRGLTQRLAQGCADQTGQSNSVTESGSSVPGALHPLR